MSPHLSILVTVVNVNVILTLVCDAQLKHSPLNMLHVGIILFLL
jgi:hypothetical protein